MARSMHRRAATAAVVAYLALWPGMNAEAFFDGSRAVVRPALTEWLSAFVKLLFASVLIWVLAPRLAADHPIAAGWTGMVLILAVVVVLTAAVCWIVADAERPARLAMLLKAWRANAPPKAVRGSRRRDPAAEFGSGGEG